MFPIVKRMLQTVYFNNRLVRRLLLKAKLIHHVCELKQAAVENRHELNLLRLQCNLQRDPRSIHVVFLVTENSKWNVQSVYDSLAESDTCSPTVVTFPANRKNADPLELAASEERNYHFFHSRKMRVVHGYTASSGYIDLRELKPDIVFYEQPHQSLPDHLWVEAVNQYALTCYVPYGILTAKIQQLQFNREFHHNLWRIFCESPTHLALARKYSDIGDRNVVISGHPKLDEYLSTAEPPCSLWPSARNPHVRRIIWAPHFSIKNREVAFSTFHKYYKLFLEFAQQRPDVEWVVKPHPWLRSAVVKYRLMTKSEIERYLSAWNELPNATLYESGNYFDLFKTSDAMILDSVSFLAEYMPTGNPMLFLVNKEPPIVGFNEFGEEIVAGLYKAYRWEDIANFISQTVVAGNDPMKAKRIDIVQRLLTPTANGAGNTIRRYFETQLLSDNRHAAEVSQQDADAVNSSSQSPVSTHLQP